MSTSSSPRIFSRREVVQVVGKADRLPEAAKIFFARRAEADVGTRQHGDDASLIGLAIFSMQRRRYRPEGGRVDPVAWPPELDAL
jgi:hypothetical protein